MEQNKRELSKKHSDSKGSRHKSRILALQTLYACETGDEKEWEIMLERIAEGESLSPSVKKYAAELVSNFFSSKEKIDELIKKKAENWDIKRMAAIDRNVMRLAVTEFLFFKDVPIKVVIDEAVELSKEFSSEESGKFVNGIIDSIRRELFESGKEGINNGRKNSCKN
ncbi:MAG: transcription antitermination factor NusB [Chitinispirillaceae bacterium]|nr:transcription antitermination factor NusB [Chitinispirillaceae bacterium]